MANPRYRRFWSEVMRGLHDTEADWQRIRTPSGKNWMCFRNDTNHCVKYIGSFCRHYGEQRLRAEAELDTGDAEETLGLYRQLEARRSKIEQSFGAELSWEPQEPNRRSRVATYFPGSMTVEEADEDPERRQEARQWLVDALGRLRCALYPVLDELWDMDDWD